MATYENGAAVLEALADPTRRTLFERLGDGGPQAVVELATHVPVSRPAVSQHLAVLKSAGLVVDRADGTRRVYSISRDGLAELRAWVDHFWGRALASFKDVAEQSYREQKAKGRRR